MLLLDLIINSSSFHADQKEDEEEEEEKEAKKCMWKVKSFFFFTNLTLECGSVKIQLRLLFAPKNSQKIYCRLSHITQRLRDFVYLIFFFSIIFQKNILFLFYFYFSSSFFFSVCFYRTVVAWHHIYCAVCRLPFARFSFTHRYNSERRKKIYKFFRTPNALMCYNKNWNRNKRYAFNNLKLNQCCK